MTKEQVLAVLENVRTWPEQDQEEFIELAREIEARRKAVYQITPDEEATIDEASTSSRPPDEEVIFKLPIDERIQLVEDLWDSIAADTAGPPLTEAQKCELDRRLDDLEANPADVLKWEDVRARLWSRVK
jgi:putative addiction module component (TIGR02574 family)